MVDLILLNLTTTIREIKGVCHVTTRLVCYPTCWKWNDMRANTGSCFLLANLKLVMQVISQSKGQTSISQSETGDASD